MASSPSSVEPVWRSAVSASEDVELARLLGARLPPKASIRAMSVTNLISPRQAYWRAFAPPTPVDLERQRRLDLGRTLHRRLGVTLSSEGALEVRVRRDGVVGRIDLLSDLPVEVKTSSSSVGPDQLPDARPEQVEQLAMYCALTDRGSGRLVTFVTQNDDVGTVQAVDIRFGEPATLRLEMQRRVEALRRAWLEHRASGLPLCRWFGRGCEFQQAAVCDCTGKEPASTSRILAEVQQLTERVDVSERIASRLREIPRSTGPPTLQRFRDLLYPRRSFFERTKPEPVSPRLPSNPLEPADLYGRLTEAVESGPLGEVARLPVTPTEPEEEVGGFRGTPYLVRTSRWRDRVTPSTLLDRHPQYVLELGFRCVATGTASARLVIGQERPDEGPGQVQVFEFHFAPSSVFARLWRERERLLATALRSSSPEGLPSCPEWMYASCPYRSECGCGASGTRSQR
ncbi:MAG: hypothetical protein WA691_08370 [Thermoplasmata archaeon]